MIIIRQKEYGLASDLYYSGLKRTASKYIGRGRRTIGNSISRSINNDRLRNIELSQQILQKSNGPLPLLRSIENEATREGVKIIPSNSRSSFYNPKTKTIHLSPKENEFDLAHELGHSRIDSGKLGKVERIIQNSPAKNLIGQREIVIRNSPPLDNPGRRGIKSIMTDAKDRWLVLKNEKDASKEGLSILKSNGATPEEIQLAEDQYKNKYKTYRLKTSANLKNTIRNTIQIPSRQQTSPLYDVKSKEQIKSIEGRYPVFKSLK